MKLSLFSFVLCRTPVFSVDAKIEEVWDDLKKHIAEASPSYYELIKDVDRFDSGKISPKISFTLWKYFNRARFRATPFGSFAAVSLVPVNTANDARSALILSSTLKRHEFVDWLFHEQGYRLASVGKLKSNSSFYHQGDEIRFVNKIDTLFQLSSIEFHDVIHRLLVFCKEVQTLTAIYTFLQDEGIPASDSRDLIEQLIEMQLMLTDQHPNSIGEDYFHRVGYKGTLSQPKYILTERNRKAGEVGAKDLEVLTALATFLGVHLPFNESAEWITFKNNFIERYENRTVPLLDVLDPEQGIGYGDFEQETTQDEFLQKLIELKNQGQNAVPSYLYTALTAFILNKLVLNQPIRLEEFNSTTEMGNYSLPNTFSALIELTDDTILLKSFGGVTATSLIGRFTLANQDFLDQAKAMVEVEAKANPEVLFFDIAYQGEKKVDNINRRASIFQYELPLVSWSESKEIIDLNEVLVTVHGGEVVLFSTKYKRRMIPRLGSAYNYVRSDLSVFRFMTDLQHQNLQSNLDLNISAIFPDLDYYPRVTFENVIITPAKWMVTSPPSSISALRAWLESKGVQDCFRTKDGDQTLFYSIENEEDLHAFILYAKSKKKVYIEEFFLPRETVVKDEQGRNYLSEMVVNLFHTQTNYSGYAFQEKSDDALIVQDTFLPGEGWLYYELYCHSSRSNEILQGLIAPFIFENKDQIEQWFFIRYTHPSDHIRFRIKVNEKKNQPSLMGLFNVDLKKRIASKQIKEVQLKPYHRELDRYGRGRIEAVEKWFEQDSILILSILSQGKSNLALYALCVEMIKDVLNKAMPDLSEQLSYVKSMTTNFTQEHQVNKAGFKLINEQYRQCFSIINIGSTEDFQDLVEPWKDSLISLIELSADLFHMHINRLFHNNQRMHEMIIYEFLYKSIQESIKKPKSM